MFRTKPTAVFLQQLAAEKSYRIRYRIQPKLDTFWTVPPTKSTTG